MWFDAGVNLTNKRLLNDLDGVMLRAHQAQVSRQLVIATNEQESLLALRLCEQYPQQLVATVGVHPHDAGSVSNDYIDKLTELASHPAVVAIGECGLDFNRNFSAPEQQLRVFAEQIQLASRLNLPLYLHEREALSHQIELLDKFCHPDIPCLSHCFTGGVNDAQAYLKRGHWFGLTGWLCDERRNAELLGALPLLPRQQLVIETDAPFLLPRSLRPRPRYNEPALLPHVGIALAQQWQMETFEIAELTCANAQRLFGLSGDAC